MAEILVVEDERELAELIREQLQLDGHRVSIGRDGEEGWLLWQRMQPDLVILDWMLPKLDGVEVCRRIRSRSIVPVLMLSARGQEMERVWGLEMGADDYMTKPFGVQELKARVRALIRRASFSRREESGEADHGFVRLSRERREVLLNGKKMNLTPKEFELLDLFLSHPNRVFSREYLLEKIWGMAYLGNDRSVDAQISRIRRKFGPHAACIQTVWGTGYKFDPERGESS